MFARDSKKQQIYLGMIDWSHSGSVLPVLPVPFPLSPPLFLLPLFSRGTNAVLQALESQNKYRAYRAVTAFACLREVVPRRRA